MASPAYASLDHAEFPTTTRYDCWEYGTVAVERSERLVLASTDLSALRGRPGCVLNPHDGDKYASALQRYVAEKDLACIYRESLLIE
jgi:hypothetical protein